MQDPSHPRETYLLRQQCRSCVGSLDSFRDWNRIHLRDLLTGVMVSEGHVRLVALLQQLRSWTAGQLVA